MLSSVSSWLLSILALIVIGTIVDILLAEGRMHKYVRGVFAIVTLFVIISPVPKLLQNGWNLQAAFGDQAIVLDTQYLESVKSFKLRTLERALVEVLAEAGVAGAVVSVVGEVGANQINVSNVSIDMTNSVIDKSKVNINKYDYVAALVANSLEISRSQVIVYG